MKKILLTAIAVYAVIIIAGATAYFLLRALAQAGSGSITYYQQEGGAQRSHEFTSEEITRIRNVLTLYDFETKDDAEASGASAASSASSAKGEAAL